MLPPDAELARSRVTAARLVVAPAVVTVALASVAGGVPSATVPAAAGTIEGRVLYEGELPRPVIVVQGGETQQVLDVDDAGGLQHAVAYLDPASMPAREPATESVEETRQGEAREGETRQGEAREGEAEPAVIDQRGYVFRPPVLAVRDGRRVRFTSQDPAQHNVRSRDPNPANAFSVDIPGLGTPEHRFVANPDHRPVELECDIHPWMAAWVYVFEHPWFDVTGAAGRFRIDDVPGGRHTLAVRHPGGALERDVEVTVEAGATTEVIVRFRSTDLHLEGRRR